MRTATTYFIRYDGGTKAAWLAEGKSPSEFENVTETTERPVLVADNGKVLYKDGVPVGEMVWLNGTEDTDYEERDAQEAETYWAQQRTAQTANAENE